MKAVVTGAAGFVGSNLCHELLRQGYEVLGIDVFSDSYDPAIKRANANGLRHENFTLVEGDLNLIDLDVHLADSTYIFHQAGQAGVRTSWGSHFDRYVAQNIATTQRLLESAKSISNLSAFVFASSSSVYGNAERYPTTELDRPQPQSPYGVTKLAAEHLCCLYASNYSVPTVSLRYFTVYGPGQRPDMAFTKFLTAAVLGSTIAIYGSGEQIRDFTYVGDVIDANIRAATSSLAPGTVANISGGSSISVNDTLRTIETITDTKLRVEYSEPLKGDVFQTGGDSSLFREATGWAPRVTMEQGLALQHSWVRDTLLRR